MALSKITLKLDASDLERLKSLLENLADTFEIKISNLRTGKIGDDVLISFNTLNSQYQLIVEKLLYNSFNVLFLDDETKKQINKIRVETKVVRDPSKNLWGAQKKGEGSKVSIEELISKNDYKGLLKIASDFRVTGDEKNRAKAGVQTAVTNSIKIAIDKAKHGKRQASDAIDELITIATDKSLKSLQKVDLVKASGLAALEICVSHESYYEEILELCTNTKLHYMVIIKAAAMFKKFILNNENQYRTVITKAKRRVNLRWIHIAFDVVENNLNYEEKMLVNEFITFFEEKA